MLAISSSPLFSTTNDNFGWLLEDLISHESTNSGETSNSSQKRLQQCDSNNIFDQIIINGGDHHQSDQTVKKNASERDRRKKINGLYSSLRSLLPASDFIHTKKLSIPSTIARILKYIPELVERLIQKKEEFISTTIYSRENSVDLNKQKRRGGIENSSLVISPSKLGDKEIVVQISTLKNNKCSIGEAISVLEDEGIVLLNATSFGTFEDRVFYTLHIQVKGTTVVEVGMLRDKLSSYFENEENLLLQ
ncbi:transcription factor ORG2-like [Solanum dulcamara]|uniref:transcription factor ORG2-like n=1 Tax=Solanum dulcamara TaxID=45834 RepID=UPI002485448E|nr:transcription factor ORG2-like [Solanum dulcamara]